MILSSAFAEPPSHRYGVPEISGFETSSGISSGYETSPSISYGVPEISGFETSSGISSGYETSSGSSYISHPVGHQPSEGLHLDPNLLETIKRVLIAHENTAASATTVYNPSSQYGAPSHHHHHHPWSSQVSDINFGHLTQSIPVAYYLSHQSYAPTHKEWTQRPQVLPPVKIIYDAPKW